MHFACKPATSAYVHLFCPNPRLGSEHMFAKLTSRLPAPLLRACAYAKAFLLLEEPPALAPAPHEHHVASGDDAPAAWPAHELRADRAEQVQDPAHGTRRHQGPLQPERLPARRPGTVTPSLQPCVSPVRHNPAEPHRRLHRPAGRPANPRVGQSDDFQHARHRRGQR